MKGKYVTKPIDLLDGEPYFIMRAKDNFALPIIRLIQNVYGLDDEFVEMFENWRKQNKHHCKDPD